MGEGCLSARCSPTLPTGVLTDEEEVVRGWGSRFIDTLPTGVLTDEEECSVAHRPILSTTAVHSARESCSSGM